MPALSFPIYAARTHKMKYGPYQGMALDFVFTATPRYVHSEILAGRLRIISPEFLTRVKQIHMSGIDVDIIEIEDLLYIDLTGKKSYLIHNKSGHDDLLYTLFESDKCVYNETERQDFNKLELQTNCLDFREKASWEPYFTRAVNMATSDITFESILRLSMKELGVIDIDTIDPVAIMTGEGDNISIHDLHEKTKASMALVYAIYFDDIVLCYEALRLLTPVVLRGFLEGELESLRTLAKVVFVETTGVGFLTHDTPADMYIRLLAIDSNQSPILAYDTFSPQVGL